MDSVSTNPTTQPSQAAREAAWALAPDCIRNDPNPGAEDRWMAGRYDNQRVMQHFARFEHDTEKRVRESLAGEANNGCFCEQMRAEGYREVCPHCIATKDWSREPTPVEQALEGDASSDVLEALSVVRDMLAKYAGQPNLYGDIYKITDAALKSAPVENLAGEANVERVAKASRLQSEHECYLLCDETPPEDLDADKLWAESDERTKECNRRHARAMLAALAAVERTTVRNG